LAFEYEMGLFGEAPEGEAMMGLIGEANVVSPQDSNVLRAPKSLTASESAE
jgi:hypothetical protein